MTAGITARGLTLRYGSVAALDDVSVSIGGGRVVGLLGRNGAGKTSFLSVLAGYRAPSAGNLLVDGASPFEAPGVVRDVCLVAEPDSAYEGWRVRDLLGFTRRFRPRWDEAYAQHLAARFGLAPSAKIPALSQGARSALGIVVGLAARAPVTAFDEAHLGLDAPSRYAFYEELLADYSAHPRTILLSTHLIEEAGSLLEEVVILDRGRVLLHEDADVLRGRGVAVTGPVAAVDRFVAGRRVLAERRLGPTKSATLYGAPDTADARVARTAGLELGPVALQDLFVHLTDPASGPDGASTPSTPPSEATTGANR